jgi:hypothetical protein
MFESRLLTEDDIPKLDTLFLSCFGSQPKETFFKWKYFSNPIGPSIVVGLFDGDVLVGSGALLPDKTIWKNQVLKSMKFTDLMTNPNYRKQGVSKQISNLLTNVLEKDCTFLYALCSNVSTKSLCGTGWTYVNKIQNYFKPLFLLKIKHLFISSRRYSFIKHSYSLTNQLDEFQFNLNDNEINIYKNVPFILWKIANPNYKYEIVYHFNEQGKVISYLIYSERNNQMCIVDFDFESSIQDINPLLLYLERTTINKKLKGIVIIGLKNSQVSNYFRTKGFITNTFTKGPLVSHLDYDICIKSDLPPGFDLMNCSVRPLNYDDI